MQKDAPIFGFNDARADIVQTVIDRVVLGTKDPLLALNDAAYHETKRLEGAKGQRQARELAEWQRLARGLVAHERRRPQEAPAGACASATAGTSPATSIRASSRSPRA